MTTRGQILRSSTPGQIPAAGARVPGEVWTNFPDLQFGIIDASRNAQRLVAVRYFSSAANYVLGDFVIQAGVLYVAKGAVTAGTFNSTQWTKVAAATDAGGPYLAITGGTLTGALVLAADPGAALGAATKQYVDGKVTAAPFLPLAGGTLLGPVVLSGAPTIPLHAATKAYVDAGAFLPIAGGTMTGDIVLARDPDQPLEPVTKQMFDARPMIGDNRIINGDFRIDQRNSGVSGTVNGYTCDRWGFGGSPTGKGTWQRNSGGTPAAAATGFCYFLTFTSSSAYAAGATDFYDFYQAIEAEVVTDFAWGTASAQPVTLSFWVYASLTGTFSGSIRNYAGTRSYPFTYSVPVASTWTKIVVTIPGDTGGTWINSSNAGSMYLIFDLGSGANSRGPANTWATTTAPGYTGTTGSVSIVATNGASWNVTGVKLEIGSVATPFNRQSLAKSLADCQRYCELGNFGFWGYNLAGASFGARSQFSVAKRALPTLTFSSVATNNCGAPSATTTSATSVGILTTVTATAAMNTTGQYLAEAEL